MQPPLPFPPGAPENGGPPVNSAWCAWWEIDPLGHYRRTSSNYCAFFGLSTDHALAGQREHDLLPEALATALATSAAAVLASGQPDRQLQALAGRWLEIIRTPVFADDGQVSGVFAIAREVSHGQQTAPVLNQNEFTYRLLADHSPDLILRFNPCGQLTYANPAALAFAGRRPEDVYGLPPEQHAVLPAADAEHLSQLIQKIVSDGQPQTVEFDWHAAGRAQHLHLRLVPEMAGDAAVSGVLLFGRDLSQLHDARLRLRQSHDLLRVLALRRQQEQETVRRDVTHCLHEDLAQELSALRMHLKLLAREQAQPPSPQLAAMEEISSRCIARMRDMVKTLRPSVLDLGIIPALQWLADDFYHGLKLKFTLKLPEQLHLDDACATFLFRSTQEALLNVALHAAATHIVIELKRNRHHLCLTISDNGQGFDPEAPRPPGAIGLLGIAEQARHLSGEFKLLTRPGHGTRLHIRLPQPARPAASA